MTYFEEQKNEIATIKTRKISLDLSDADVRSICEKAGQVGLTVSELLQNFIGDLVGGTYSNGSDERDFSQQWFDRCGFEMVPDESFSRYLLNISHVDGALVLWNSILENRIELKQMEASLQKSTITKDDIASIQEDIDCLNEEISCYTEELTALFEDYKEHGGTDASLEVGMKSVLQWQTEFKQISNAQEKNRQGVAGKLEAAKQQVAEQAAAAPSREHTQNRSSGHSR